MLSALRLSRKYGPRSGARWSKAARSAASVGESRWAFSQASGNAIANPAPTSLCRLQPASSPVGLALLWGGLGEALVRDTLGRLHPESPTLNVAAAAIERLAAAIQVLGDGRGLALEIQHLRSEERR